MDCLKCRRVYRLYGYSYSDSGMALHSFCWVRKEKLIDAEKREQQIMKQKGAILNAAASRYMNDWLSLFQNLKSRRAIWEKLTDNGKRNPSLATFYNHTRNLDIRIYLRREFEYDNLSTILDSLEVDDPGITKRLRRIEQLNSTLREAKVHLVKDGYR